MLTEAPQRTHPGRGKVLMRQVCMMARPLTACMTSGRFFLSFRFLICKVGIIAIPLIRPCLCDRMTTHCLGPKHSQCDGSNIR